MRLLPILLLPLAWSASFKLHRHALDADHPLRKRCHPVHGDVNHAARGLPTTTANGANSQSGTLVTTTAVVMTMTTHRTAGSTGEGPGTETGTGTGTLIHGGSSTTTTNLVVQVETTLGISGSITSSAGFSASAIASSLPMKENRLHVYTVDIELGEEKRKVPMLVDTGSYSMWAASKTCASCAQMVGSLDIGSGRCEKASATYGTGGWEGCMVSTPFGLGPYRIPDFKMAAADNIDTTLASFSDCFSGIFGLGLNRTKGYSTPTDRLLASGQLDDPWVGFRLSRGGANSEIIFGDALTSPHADPNKHVTLPQATSNSSLYYVKLDGMKVGNLSVQVPGVEVAGVATLLDTGTSNFMIPKPLVAPVLSALAGGVIFRSGEHYLVPCDAAVATAEVISLAYGGKDYGMQFQDVIYGEDSNMPGWCATRISSVSDTMWIIGEPFLISVYHAVNTVDGSVQIWGIKP